VALFSISSPPISLYFFDYHKSYPSWTLAWGTLSFYPAHLRSWCWNHFPTTWVITFSTDMSISDCLCLTLDLVITLAKSHLVLVFSVEDTPIWACSLSWQPSLRAFSQCSFMMSFLYWSQPTCTLVSLETHSWQNIQNVSIFFERQYFNPKAHLVPRNHPRLLCNLEIHIISKNLKLWLFSIHFGDWFWEAHFGSWWLLWECLKPFLLHFSILAIFSHACSHCSCFVMHGANCHTMASVHFITTWHLGWTP